MKSVILSQCKKCGGTVPVNKLSCSSCGAWFEHDPARNPHPLQRHELASWGVRLCAFVVDSILSLVFASVPVIVIFALGYGFGLEVANFRAILNFLEIDGSYSSYANYSEDRMVAWLALLGTVGFICVIFWEIWWLSNPRYGAKPGQSLCGFRVVRASDTTMLTQARAWGRLWGKAIYGLTYVLYVVSAITIFSSSKKQALHDIIAGTVCVKKEALAQRGVGPDALRSQGQTPPPSSGPFI